MGKIKTPQTLSNIDNLDDLVRFTSQMTSDIVSTINGGISFTDNCRTSLVTFTFTGVGTIGVGHGLGSTPLGYAIVGRSTNIQVFDSTTDNTSDKIYLQSTGAGTVKVLVFA